MTIEKILAQKKNLKIEHQQLPVSRRERDKKEREQGVHFDKSEKNLVEQEHLLDILLKPDKTFEEGINHALLNESRKRRRKQKQQHL